MFRRRAAADPDLRCPAARYAAPAPGCQRDAGWPRSEGSLRRITLTPATAPCTLWDRPPARRSPTRRSRRTSPCFSGLTPVAQMFTLPSGTEQLSIDYSADAVFIYRVRKAMDLAHLHSPALMACFSAPVPPPKGYDAATTKSPVRVFSTARASACSCRTATDGSRSTRTRDETSLDLGVQPASFSSTANRETCSSAPKPVCGAWR